MRGKQRKVRLEDEKAKRTWCVRPEVLETGQQILDQFLLCHLRFHHQLG